MKGLFKKLRENKKGFTLAELLVVVAIVGVLVAISIPIFTAQLEKARLATNQANARAAKAAATTQFMLDYAESGATDAVSYTYTVSDGTGSFDNTVKTADTGLSLTISDWSTTNEATSGKLGKVAAKEWVVVMDEDGAVTGYKGTD